MLSALGVFNTSSQYLTIQIYHKNPGKSNFYIFLRQFAFCNYMVITRFTFIYLHF